MFENVPLAYFSRLHLRHTAGLRSPSQVDVSDAAVSTFTTKRSFVHNSCHCARAMLRVASSNSNVACLLRSLRFATDGSRGISSIAPSVLHRRPDGHDIDRETMGDGGSSGVAAYGGQRRAFGTRQVSQKKKDMQKNAKKQGQLRQQQKGSSNEEKIAFMSKILDAKPPPK